MDQRTLTARALRDRYESVAADLGGLQELSGIRASLLERFIHLEAVLVRLESEMAAAGDAVTASEIMGRWIQACNALVGIGKTLGLDRKAKVLDLKSYVSANGEAHD
jgi:hypothetical protein